MSGRPSNSAPAGTVAVSGPRSSVALGPGAHGVRGRLRALLRRAAAAEGRAPDEAWDSMLVRLFGRSRTTVGNAIVVHGDGDAWMADLCASIDEADEEVWIESYTVRDDDTGRRVRGCLVAAAERGVEVVLIYDAAGSAGLGAAYLDPLLRAGGRVGVFGPALHWWRDGALRRNHRKSVVIDGVRAFVGGMNIGNDYVPEHSGEDCFEDVHLRLDGPVAGMLRDRMGRLLRAASLTGGAALEGASAGNRTDGRPDCGDGVVQVLETDGVAGRREIQAAMRVVLSGARHTIDIATPYFVPPRRLVETLIAAAHRGVRVRILTAGRSDVPIVPLAARHVYDRLLTGGIGIHELHDRTLHAKVTVVDGEYAMVGSFNLDQWSDRRNMEMNVGFVDAETTVRLVEWIQARLDRAVAVDAAEHASRPWWKRAIHATAWWLMHL